MAPTNIISDNANSTDPQDMEEQSSSHTGNGSAIHIRSGELPRDSNDGPHPPPRFLQDQSSSTRWRWVPVPIRRVSRAVATWAQGPQPPQPQKISAFFPRVQTAPVRYLDRFLPKKRHKIALLVAFYFCWLLVFAAVLHHSAKASEIEGYGEPTQIGCGATYWSDGNGCGLNGNDCRPFDNSTFAFRCPGNCIGTQVLNPHAVGDQEILYQPLVIGGPSAGGAGHDAVYRGDSFLCGAAIHAGIVTNKAGGCGVVKLVGEGTNYSSTTRNHITSIGFDSSFPLSYSFVEGVPAECKDLRWPLLGVSIAFTVLLSLFTMSPGVFFVSIFVGIYFQVGLSSDPPSTGDYFTIVSILLGRFLPAAFVAFVLYRYCIRRTLDGLNAQVEKTILWLGGCWVGALTNYTFDFIPIQRLTPHDINQQPGAKAALAVIAICLLLIVAGQIWYFRLEGRLPRYLGLYIFFCVMLGLFVAIPGLNLRIHHYILAILLTPGTSMQTRPSLLYQGILMGFFINGIARWGFDSILQTPAALRGDGQFNSMLPTITTPQLTADNITFSWSAPRIASNGNGTYDGISVLVNDVERFRGFQGYDPDEFTWSREPRDELPYYFRFAYVQGSSSADYTKAGTWKGDGRWVPMEEGPSKIKI
ncbi:MAG: hypothetical protein M4579_006292 [Chaenotheca gracillima]|nr:MAG: hypothetical protein M4579_006292 [Chaenotheca gracillima]